MSQLLQSSHCVNIPHNIHSFADDPKLQCTSIHGVISGLKVYALSTLLDIKAKSFSHVWLLATPWTVAHQAPQSTEFSTEPTRLHNLRQDYWNGLPFQLAFLNCLLILLPIFIVFFFNLCFVFISLVHIISYTNCKYILLTWCVFIIYDSFDAYKF